MKLNPYDYNNNLLSYKTYISGEDASFTKEVEYPFKMSVVLTGLTVEYV
jgi:hypothetical protein